MNKLMRKSVAIALPFVFGLVLGIYISQPNLSTKTTEASLSDHNATSSLAKPIDNIKLVSLNDEPKHTLPEVKLTASPGKTVIEKEREGIDIDTELPDIDSQIQSELQLDETSLAQASEIIMLDDDWVEPLYSMTKQEQKKAIEQFIVSNDDNAVRALADLILSDEQFLQQKAIDGLITILEQRTGHYDQISEILSQNEAFLSDNQLNLVKNLTAMP